MNKDDWQGEPISLDSFCWQISGQCLVEAYAAHDIYNDCVPQGFPIILRFEDLDVVLDIAEEKRVVVFRIRGDARTVYPLQENNSDMGLYWSRVSDVRHYSGSIAQTVEAATITDSDIVVIFDDCKIVVDPARTPHICVTSY